VTEEDFDRMITRLERYSAEEPGGYQLRVAGLAALGLLILFGIIGFAGLVLAGILAAVVAIALTSGALLVLLLKLGKLVLLLVIPLWVLVRSSFQAMFARFPEPKGHEILPAQAPALFDRLAWMRKHMHGPRFHHVLLIDDVNAAVVQRPLFGLFGFPRNYLILGLPLLEALTEREALAVVAHEYGHLAGAHSRFGAFIYRLRNTWGTIDAIARQWDGFGGKMLGKVVRWYAPYFNAYTFVLARSHEYLADAASGELVGAGHAINALKRVNIHVREYQEYLEDTFDRVRTEAEPPAGFAQRWAEQVAVGAPEERTRKHLEAALARKTDHLDTHPALADRLNALHPGTTHELPEALAELSAAQAWFGPGIEAIRSAMEAQWSERMREPWRERFAQHEQARARLAELAGRESLDRDEQWERFVLRRQVSPSDTDREALEAFVTAWPEDARGYYARGHLRLEQEDEGGIEDLETAMRLDPECVIAAASRSAAFLYERDRPRADAYAARAQQRHELEERRLEEIRNPKPGHPLRPHGLPEESLHAVEEAVRRAQVVHLDRAWLVRRELPSDPSVETYLLAVGVTWWGRRRGRQQSVVDAVAAIAMPTSVPNVFICSTDGENADLGDLIRMVEGSELRIR
jgi:Zn-dependent protease with chaperone function